MTDREEFDRTLECLELPEVGELRHQEYVRRSILGAKRSAALTIWYVLIPAYVLLGAAMKAVFLGEPDLFAVFDGIVRALARSALGEVFPALLLLGLPLAALLVNLAALVRVSWTPDGDEWRIAVRRRPINLLIALLGLLAAGSYLAYLMLRV